MRGPHAQTHPVPAHTWRPARGRRSIAAFAVLAAGVAAMAAGVLFWRTAPDPSGPLYRYVVDAALTGEQAQSMRPITERGIALEQGRVVVDDEGDTVADFVLARSDDGPILLDWRARVDEPFLTLLPQPQELVAVADAIRRHLPADGVVLGWWDTSRALRLLAGVPVLFDRHLGEPLIVPAHWQAQSTSVVAADRAFFAAGGEASAASSEPVERERERFHRFVDALLSDETSGIATLRELAAGRPAVVVLHVRDALLLGAIDPARIGVAFRDLPGMGPSHQAIRHVRDWMSTNDLQAYTVLHREGQPLRAVALTDEASGETLAARLLPFIGNRQSDVAGATLVYRTGAFVVFELDTRATSESASAGARTFASLSK